MVASAQDRMLPTLSEASRLQRCIPHARRVVLPASSHAPLLERDVCLASLLQRAGFHHRQLVPAVDRLVAVQVGTLQAPESDMEDATAEEGAEDDCAEDDCAEEGAVEVACEQQAEGSGEGGNSGDDVPAEAGDEADASQGAVEATPAGKRMSSETMVQMLLSALESDLLSVPNVEEPEGAPVTSCSMDSGPDEEVNTTVC